MANKYFNMFVFAVGNKTGEYASVMMMLPSGSYSSADNAAIDLDGYDNVTMPREFQIESSVGVPICRMTLKWSGGLSNLSHIATKDYRRSGATGGGGSDVGITTLLQATDFPSSYAGEGEKLLQVNTAEDAVEFIGKDEVLLTELDSTGFQLTQSQIVDLSDTLADYREYVYESEISADGQTTVALPWTLKGTSRIIYNDTRELRLSEWSGIGTTTLTFLFDTMKYEYVIVRR